MTERVDLPSFDCQGCASCCRKGQPIELYVSEIGKLSKNTKLRIDVARTLEENTLLWKSMICELMEDCGNLIDLADGRFACKVYNTSEMPDACKASQPGWDFCLDAIEDRKAFS